MAASDHSRTRKNQRSSGLRNQASVELGLYCVVNRFDVHDSTHLKAPVATKTHNEHIIAYGNKPAAALARFRSGLENQPGVYKLLDYQTPGFEAHFGLS